MSSSRWLRWLRPAPASVTALALASASCLLRLCLLSLYLPIHFHDSRHFPPIYFPSQHTMIDYFYALRYISTPVKSVYPSCPAMPMAQITLGNTLRNPVNSIGTQVILPSYGSDQPNHLSCHAYGSDQPDQLSYHLWLRSRCPPNVNASPLSFQGGTYVLVLCCPPVFMLYVSLPVAS
jgi:hypothetical protein